MSTVFFFKAHVKGYTRKDGTVVATHEDRRPAKKEHIAAFAEHLSGAYSTDRYRGGWSGCIRMLLGRGYDEHQIEGIIRSKWTRRAAESAQNNGKPYGQATGADLAKFMDSAGITLEEINQVADETSARRPPRTGE